MEIAGAIATILIVAGSIGTAIYLWLDAKFKQYDAHIQNDKNDADKFEDKCALYRERLWESVRKLDGKIQDLSDKLNDFDRKMENKMHKIDMEILKIEMKKGVSNDTARNG